LQKISGAAASDRAFNFVYGTTEGKGWVKTNLRKKNRYEECLPKESPRLDLSPFHSLASSSPMKNGVDS